MLHAFTTIAGVRRRSLSAALILALVLALWVAPVMAVERLTGETPTLPAGQTVDDDLIISGNSVTVAGHVKGDLYAFGNFVTILPSAQIDGDVITAGNIITIAGMIGGDVRTAGNTISLSATVARNVLMAGNQVTLGSAAAVKGNVVSGAAVLSVLGPIDGRLTGGGGQVQLNSVVGRDAELWVDSLVVQPSARIGGRLTYTAPVEQALPASLAQGPVQWLPTPQPAPTQPPTATERMFEALGGQFSLLWLLGTILFGLLLAWLTPGFYRTGATIVRQRGLVALAVGLATLVLTPIVALLLLVSVVGLPIGLLSLGAYLTGWYLGWLVVAPALVGLVIGLVRAGQSALAVGWLVVIGLVALHFLTRLPYLGGLLAIAVLCLGLGVLVLAIIDRLHRPAPAQPTPPAIAAPPTPHPMPSA